MYTIHLTDGKQVGKRASEVKRRIKKSGDLKPGVYLFMNRKVTTKGKYGKEKLAKVEKRIVFAVEYKIVTNSKSAMRIVGKQLTVNKLVGLIPDNMLSKLI